MMAITTRSSIKVNAERALRIGLFFMRNKVTIQV